MQQLTNQLHTADFLKRRARQLSNQTEIPLHEALKKVAQEAGFANWEHFINTKAAMPSEVIKPLESIDRPIPYRFEKFSSLSVTKEEAALLLEKAKQVIPVLTRFGIGIFDQASEERQHGHAFVAEKIAEGQSTMADYLHEIAISAEWLNTIKRIKTINKRRHTSYGYKHRVEQWCRTRLRSGESVPDYVANGCFIAAAVGLGFKFEVSGPNAYFNISQTAWKLDYDQRN